MNKWLNKIDQLSPSNLFGCIVAFSILLAAWMQYIQHGWISPDSVLYLEQARLFVAGNIKSAVEVFNWPLYGACIGFVHKITLLDIHVSAQFLNMLFFGLATASYLNIIKLSGGKNRALLLGALLLFSSQYIVGDVLAMLLRDEGFWAFYLSAIVFFIRYNQQQKIPDAILWQACIIIATLFRIEAILFLLFLPLIYFLEQEKPITWRLKKIVNTYSLSIVVAISIGIALAMQPQLNMTQFSRLQEVFTLNLYQELTQKLFTQAAIMSDQVLGKYLEAFSIPALLLTFLYVIGYKIISTTGIIGTGLAVLGLKHQYLKKQALSAMPAASRRILIAASLIACVSMALIITKVFVLSGRYVLSLSWVLLIFSALYLAAISASRNKKTRIAFLIIIIILSLGFIKNILPKQNGYNYRQEAVTWIKKHHKNNAAIFYDDIRLNYYAKSNYSGNSALSWDTVLSAIEDKSIYKNEFLLISHSKKHPQRYEYVSEKLPSYIEIKRFNNRKKKKYIVIYKRTSSN